ncbi:unnamed protein product (macronuclear) [Paramecium tetraurelia]|uniref:Uncharacterized protein n=1 Tax=Paramecium tetraurelia TaxID=5888 RepID=A0CAC9_PARTE|nr:uncharacterized protein GSPATT00036526001 [Paramecium tetraurelia]CAK67746.1 unnamed protein product [Paramecium tetraurelia]|eukprot:XP_001435143.1 hypothetical protein (macronuclear) [Paramecium tetraurelia strain d4-2]
MSLIVYGTKLMNLYCVFQITWKTQQAFKNQNSEFEDTLLIKWVLLYSFIELEWMFTLILELIPFGFIVPFIIKGYIILPHSRWHNIVYKLIQNLEMDEYTNTFFIYFTKLMRYILIPCLSVVENCIDLVRANELEALELKVIRIKEKILNKIQSVEINKQKHRARNSDIIQNNINNKQLMSVLAKVQDNHQFKDYNLIFNPLDNEIQFIDPMSMECIHKRNLILISISEDFSLKATYEDGDGNLESIKLHNSEDINKWLIPVLEILIQQNQDE